MKPVLSILTPGVPSRMDQIKKLQDELDNQIGDRPVEHLILIDNKRRTVGEKRDALLRASIGEFVAYVDDDDWVSYDYVRSLLDCARLLPDVITFQQESNVNGLTGTIEFRLGNPNEEFYPGRTIKRNAWHVCAWRRSLAILSSFPKSNYGEDWEFARKLCGLQGIKEFHIPKVLHYYRHDIRTTEAPPGLG